MHSSEFKVCSIPVNLEYSGAPSTHKVVYVSEKYKNGKVN